MEHSVFFISINLISINMIYVIEIVFRSVFENVPNYRIQNYEFIKKHRTQRGNFINCLNLPKTLY